MAKTLRQILGARTLTGVIQTIKSGVPRVLPEAFFRVTRTVEGNTCTYLKVEGTRKVARLVQYGSPSKARGLKGVAETPITLLHALENIQHKPATLMNLRNMENEGRQKLGAREVARQTRIFADRFTNLRVSAAISGLVKGVVYFDGDGNLLVSSGSAVTTIDFHVPAGNKNQLDVFGTGAIIGASWATASTKIAKQLKALKRAARKKTGYPLHYAFYGENILDYLLANTQLKELISRNAAWQAAALQGEIASGFMGFEWVPIDEAFYEDNDGTLQEWCGADTIVFTPTPTPDWYEVIEGTYPVATDIGSVYADERAALASIREESGMFSYAIITADPAGIKQVSGDTFLHVVKVPAAIFIADVTP